MCGDNNGMSAAREPLVDEKTGFPIDAIDGTQCQRSVPPPIAAQTELEHNRMLDHQMVEMGRVVGGNSIKMELPCHVNEEDDRND